MSALGKSSVRKAGKKQELLRKVLLKVPFELAFATGWERAPRRIFTL